MANEALLEVRDLHVIYKTPRATAYALNGASFTVEKGETFGLVGETGAGKTTTALSILGLLPKGIGKVTGGEILFKGQSLLKMNEKQLENIRGKEIAMVFQNPLTSLNPVFTVGEQIAMVYRRHQNMGKREALEAAGRMLETVGIPKTRINDYPHQFSGGMRQRVGIAAALACDPELLIADEATTALDVTIQAQVLGLMKNLQKEYGSSFIVITHNLGIISELCQKVAVMYAGTIVEYGTVLEVFRRPLHWYTQGLLGAIPSLEGPRNRLANIPGNVANAQNLPDGCKFHTRCQHCTEACKKDQPPYIRVNDDHYVACWNMEG